MRFMTHLQKLRIRHVLKWVSSDFSQRHLRSSKTLLLGSFFHIDQTPRFYGRKRAVQLEKCQNLDDNTNPVDIKSVGWIPRAARAEAQQALLEYLHSTRSLQFMDAENMSRNSPHFLEKLLKEVESGPAYELDIGRSVARFLRYHPINEFEPFFESIGLKPSEFVYLLPSNLMFLTDDNMLLENYQVLCNYGIARNKIGKIYKEAMQIFQYESGILQSKLQAYEELGLNQSVVIMAVASCPSLLVGDVNSEFVKVLDVLKSVGIQYRWIGVYLLEENSYNWRRILDLLCLLSKIGCNRKQIGELISQHPELLFQSSGNRTLSLTGFLLKFGSTMNEIQSMLLRFPQVQVDKFLLNMRRCYIFLVEIEMEVKDIGRIVRSHALLVGSCSLKKTSSLLSRLSIGKKRLCGVIKENPLLLKNWVLGSRVKPLPHSGEDEISHMEKIKFLLNLGFVENSDDMKKALKAFRGKGEELSERFACFLKAGLDRQDVLNMVKTAPYVLNQSKDVIEMKLDFLVNDLGYSVSSLVSFPSIMSYTVQRVKLRFSMYTWLKDRGSVRPNLALRTLISCSDDYYMSHYVKLDPEGPKVWKELKKQIYSD